MPGQSADFDALADLWSSHDSSAKEPRLFCRELALVACCAFEASQRFPLEEQSARRGAIVARKALAAHALAGPIGQQASSRRDMLLQIQREWINTPGMGLQTIIRQTLFGGKPGTYDTIADVPGEWSTPKKRDTKHCELMAGILARLSSANNSSSFVNDSLKMTLVLRLLIAQKLPIWRAQSECELIAAAADQSGPKLPESKRSLRM